jgi:hypothetical protein
MSVLQSYGPVRRRMLTPYLLIWVAAAALATGYLALLGVKPEFFAHPSNTADLAQQLVQTKRDVTRAVADLDPLRHTVGEMKLDVTNLQYAAKETAAHDAALDERVSALETSSTKRPEMARIGEATTDSAQAPAAVPPAPMKDPRKAAAKAPKPAAVVAPLSSAPKNAKMINGATKQAQVPSETGSIEHGAKAAPVKTAQAGAHAKTAAVAHPGAAAVKAPATAKTATAAKPGAVGVVLATGASVDALKLNWTILNDRHSDAVKGLTPHYTVSGPANNRVYSLVAGPVASAEQAKSLCQTMEQKGMTCSVSAYRGSAL